MNSKKIILNNSAFYNSYNKNTIFLGVCTLIALYRVGLISPATHTECQNSMQYFFLNLFLTGFILHALLKNFQAL